MLVLKNEKLNERFNLPQNYNEINFQYLENCVNHIKLAKHYCIIGLITIAKISEILDTRNNHTGVTKFIIVKHRTDSNNDIIEKNKIVILAPSEAFNGIDCNNIKNELSSVNISSFIEADTSLRLSILKGDIFKNVSTGSVKALIDNNGKTIGSPSLDVTTSKNAVIVGFKIVPESCIIANTGNSLKESGTIEYIVEESKQSITNG